MSMAFRAGLAAAIILAASLGARAADLPLKAPPAPAATVGWTGIYVGGFVGGAWGAGTYSTADAACQTGPGGCNGAPGQIFFQGAGSIPATYDLDSSVIGGITAGINWQSGRAVFGLESETGYIHMSGSGRFLTNGAVPCNPATPLAPPCSDYAAASTLGNWYAAFTLRAGVTGDWLMPGGGDRTLLYVKAGPALTRFSTGVNAANFPGATFATLNISGADDVWGVAAGGGAEWAFTNNLSLKAEYEYLGFDRTVQACGLAATAAGAPIPNAPYCTSTQMHGVHTAKLGINWKLSDRVWPF
jgi:outer membrane immunogenic protein